MSCLYPDTQTRVEVFQDLQSQDRDRLSSQRGQAIIEYVLLMVVVLALAIGLARQFFTPVRQFTQFVLGNYIECLLDQGQLPALGGESRLVECEFDVNATFGAAGFGGPGSSGGPGPGRGTGAQNQSEAQRRLAQRPRDGGSTESPARRGPRRFSLGQGRSPGLGDPGSPVAEAETATGQTSNRFMRFRDSRARDREARRRVIVSQSRFIRDPFSMRSSARQAPVPIRAPSAGTQSAAPARRSFQIDPSKPLRTPKELPLTAGWSFGVWLRYLLIIIILIALILFIIGQVNQISKGMQKS